MQPAPPYILGTRKRLRPAALQILSHATKGRITPAEVSFILVVDQEPAIRSLIALALHREGLPVLTAANGTEAIAVSRSHPRQIDLLIADALMPEMERGNLASELLSNQPEMRILLLSSRHMPPAQGRFAYADFLAKPFSIEMLLATVRGLLQSIRSRPAA